MSYSFGWIEIHCVDHCNNKCLYCNNHAMHAKKKEYAAGEYMPWLDVIQDMGIKYYCISVMGGEPFLHSNLENFVTPLREKYDQSLMLTTNGFWLSDDAIEKYESLFNKLDILCFSLYKNMEARYGGMENARRLIGRVTERHPAMRVEIRAVQTFTAFEITDAPLTVDRYCGAADCTCLLADGRLGRCGVGSFAHLDPNVSAAFLHAKDMFYDLAAPAEDFWMWRKRWPLDACRYCSHFRCEQVAWDYAQRIPPKRR